MVVDGLKLKIQMVVQLQFGYKLKIVFLFVN